MATKTSPKKSLLDYFKPSDNGDSKESKADTNSTCSGRSRPTRACASKARQAWNGDQEVSISSDEDDFEQTSRKRTRTGSRKKQATLSSNGSVVAAKDKNGKKKVKLDPETEAFLRSGVPDVINVLKSRPKSLDSNAKSQADDKSSTVISNKRKTLDAATLAFLHSGVPDVVDKARQTVEKRRDQDEFLVNMGFFPKTTHTTTANPEVTKENSNNDKSVFCQIKYKSRPDLENEDSDVVTFREPLSHFKFISKDKKSLPIGLCCEENPITISSQDTNSSGIFSSQDEDDNNSQKESSPWIDRLKVTNVRNLVVDKTALETFTNWLKRWKMDIKDDGGTSRKHERKKKRGNSSDSDFVTSDEDESEMKKKSVLLTGPSGCGKTAAVYVLAKHYGFVVVEVNFSTRRPGKEVLQRVEEAVLSHRLKSSQNCLLLFKDIDLLHPEEDEGFCSAVAQLITTAVRPIVMTSCLPVYCLIDSKLDRKDPLRISFTLPKPKDIVDRVLKPILLSNGSGKQMSDYNQIGKWLDSIVRHCGCDIRQSINQLQLVLTTSNSPFADNKTCLSNHDIHLYSTPFLPHLVDLNFPRQCNEDRSDSQNFKGNEEDEVNLTKSARNKRCIKQLERLADGLELFSDLDWISRLSSSLPNRNVNVFGDVEETKLNWNYSGMRNCFFTRLSLGLQQTKSEEMGNLNGLLRELVLESDVEVDKWTEIDGVNDEIGQYCDRAIGANGVDWESCGAVRTIVKTNMLDSIGGKQKRHGRMTSYFNRLDRRLVDRISETFDFQKSLDIAKVAF